MRIEIERERKGDSEDREDESILNWQIGLNSGDCHTIGLARRSLKYFFFVEREKVKKKKSLWQSNIELFFLSESTIRRKKKYVLGVLKTSTPKMTILINTSGVFKESTEIYEKIENKNKSRKKEEEAEKENVSQTLRMWQKEREKKKKQQKEKQWEEEMGAENKTKTTTKLELWLSQRKKK